MFTGAAQHELLMLIALRHLCVGSASYDWDRYIGFVDKYGWQRKERRW